MPENVNFLNPIATTSHLKEDVLSMLLMKVSQHGKKECLQVYDVAELCI